MRKKIIFALMLLTFSFVCSMFFFGINGSAYIDPSVMTYMIQAVAGIIIAAGAGLAIYFRKAKKKINDTLGIDENRNKEVESDEIIVKTDAGTGDASETDRKQGTEDKTVQ